MYLAQAFSEVRSEVIEGLLADFPLATLTVASAQGLVVNHLPLLREGELLQGHVAGGNKLLGLAAHPVVAVFQGPQGHVSPAWYPEQALHDRRMPGWNHAEVQVHVLAEWMQATASVAGPESSA